MTKPKIEHKTYGESQLEIAHDWYSVSEIKEMLETIKTYEGMNKKIFRKYIQDMNG